MVCDNNAPHVVWVGRVDRGQESLESEEDKNGISKDDQGCCLETILVCVVHSELEKQYIYPNNSFLPVVTPTRVQDTHYSCPHNVVSLSRGFCSNLFILL